MCHQLCNPRLSGFKRCFCFFLFLLGEKLIQFDARILFLEKKETCDGKVPSHLRCIYTRWVRTVGEPQVAPEDSRPSWVGETGWWQPTDFLSCSPRYFGKNDPNLTIIFFQRSRIQALTIVSIVWVVSPVPSNLNSHHQDDMKHLIQFPWGSRRKPFICH